MNKILVTGANGFIGNALCRELNNRNFDFIPVVRKASQSQHYSVGNFDESTQWEGALKNCDIVIHLAARVHVMNDTAVDPLSAFRETNVIATLNLARQAAANGVRRFIFFSSVKVNGEETNGLPFTACDDPQPLDPYGQSKLEAEIALQQLALETGLELVIIRPPLVYGPGVGANFLKLMQLVKSGIPLPFGLVHNRRSMVALDNIIDIVISCAQHPAAVGQTFMVSDDQDISISELLRMISTAMGKRSRLFPVPVSLISGIATLLGKSDVAGRLLGSLQVDINHTKSVLDWKPVVSMEESIKKTVVQFLKN